MKDRPSPHIPVLKMEDASPEVKVVYEEFYRRMSFPSPPNFIMTQGHSKTVPRGTLEAVVKARNAAVTAQRPSAQAVAENALSGALRQLIALSESYPDLKANSNFQELQRALSDLENKIAASRRFFNNAVQEYNTAISQFPAALFAARFGFAPREYFEADEDRKTLEQAPQVKF